MNNNIKVIANHIDVKFYSKYFLVKIFLTKRTAAIHYYFIGWRKRFDPNKDFDTRFYIQSNPSVKKKGINPFVHYLETKEDNNKEEKKASKDFFNFQFEQNARKSPYYKEFFKKKPIDTDIKLIAYYLPQFHPIPQNDKAWGKGFTEWTNVSKAIPQFEGHHQPQLPGELGFYDLREIEVQKRQIELAKNYGLHGFCYHYYWFDGKKVMDTPLQQILDNPDLDFPFCINWANENWTKRWDGLDNEVILAQNHTPEDDILFLEAIKPILTDKRYIKVNGKPLLMIYRPQLFPNIKSTVERWRKHAKDIGIGDLYLVLTHAFKQTNPLEIGFDAATEFAPNSFNVTNVTNSRFKYNLNYTGNINDYISAVNYSINYKEPNYTKFRSAFPGWDNEARKPGKGISFVNSEPHAYEKWLDHLLHHANDNRDTEEKLIFLNAWNEWAEGAVLEPSRKYGYSYLESTYNSLSKFDTKRLELLSEPTTPIKESNIAVILHLYYVELWEEIKEQLNNFKESIDLYININQDASNDIIKKIKLAYPKAHLSSYENRGRDILPFLKTMNLILELDYKYICKIHSKKSLHRGDGDQWRNHLIQSLIGSAERIKQSKDAIDNGSGIIVAKGNALSYNEWKGSNEIFINAFSKKIKASITGDFLFPAGSMFWFNPIIFEKSLKNLNLNEFNLEEGQIDGTIAHATERIFGLLCKEYNLKIEEI